MNYAFPPIPERIQWHEGMLLAPQHFQQSQARTDSLAGWHALAAAPLAWGVRHLEVDTSLLANGLFWLTSVAATRVMAFQSKKDGPGGPLNKFAVVDATTLAIPPTMAQPLVDPSTQAMARQASQRVKLL